MPTSYPSWRNSSRAVGISARRNGRMSMGAARPSRRYWPRTRSRCSDPADGSYRVLDALRVLVPELRELRLVKVRHHIADILDGLGELGVGSRLACHLAQARDHGVRCALGSEKPNPQRE